MNKLANTYLDAVASLMAIHFSHPGQEDWPLIVANLADAVRTLATSLSPEDAADKNPNLLTLADLKNQVDIWFSKNYEWSAPFPNDFVLMVDDFEIRRRK